MRHRDTPSGQKIIFKYWLIEKETCNSTLAQSSFPFYLVYLGIAKQIYSTSNCSIKNFQTFFLYNTSNLDEKIEADEQKTLERYWLLTLDNIDMIFLCFSSFSIYSFLFNIIHHLSGYSLSAKPNISHLCQKYSFF